MRRRLGSRFQPSGTTCDFAATGYAGKGPPTNFSSCLPFAYPTFYPEIADPDDRHPHLILSTTASYNSVYYLFTPTQTASYTFSTCNTAETFNLQRVGRKYVSQSSQIK